MYILGSEYDEFGYLGTAWDVRGLTITDSVVRMIFTYGQIERSIDIDLGVEQVHPGMGFNVAESLLDASAATVVWGVQGRDA